MFFNNDMLIFSYRSRSFVPVLKTNFNGELFDVWSNTFQFISFEYGNLVSDLHDVSEELCDVTVVVAGISRQECKKNQPMTARVTSQKTYAWSNEISCCFDCHEGSRLFSGLIQGGLTGFRVFKGRFSMTTSDKTPYWSVYSYCRWWTIVTDWATTIDTFLIRLNEYSYSWSFNRLKYSSRNVPIVVLVMWSQCLKRCQQSTLCSSIN